VASLLDYMRVAFKLRNGNCLFGIKGYVARIGVIIALAMVRMKGGSEPRPLNQISLMHELRSDRSDD
jgi:hypothetical protein